jgi:hypothetical protein
MTVLSKMAMISTTVAMSTTCESDKTANKCWLVYNWFVINALLSLNYYFTMKIAWQYPQYLVQSSHYHIGNPAFIVHQISEMKYCYTG